MPLKLTITSYQRLSPGQEISKLIDREPLTIGRAAQNDWVLQDPERILSKHHCTVLHRDGAYFLTDFSVNGTYLNDSEQRVARNQTVELRDGDHFVVGEYEIAVTRQTETGGASDPFADGPLTDVVPPNAVRLVRGDPLGLDSLSAADPFKNNASDQRWPDGGNLPYDEILSGHRDPSALSRQGGPVAPGHAATVPSPDLSSPERVNFELPSLVTGISPVQPVEPLEPPPDAIPLIEPPAKPDPIPLIEPPAKPDPIPLIEPPAKPDPIPLIEPPAKPDPIPLIEPLPEPKTSSGPAAEPLSEPSLWRAPTVEPPFTPSLPPSATPLQEPLSEPSLKSAPAAESPSKPLFSPAPTVEPPFATPVSRAKLSGEPLSRPSPAAEPLSKPSLSPTPTLPEAGLAIQPAPATAALPAAALSIPSEGAGKALPVSAEPSFNPLIPDDWFLQPAAPPAAPVPAQPLFEPLAETSPAKPSETTPEKLFVQPAAQPLPVTPPLPPAARPPSAAPPSPEPAMAPSAELLLRIFCKGAGLSQLRLEKDQVAELAFNLGAILRETVQGLMEILLARGDVKGEFRLDRTTLGPVENNPLKTSPGQPPLDAETVIKLLLVPPKEAYMPPVQAVRESFDDIKAHQLAVVAGIQAALDHLLERFDPGNLEDRLEQNVLDNLWPANRKAKYWDLFTAEYQAIAREAEDDFNKLFGDEFARAYESRLRGR